MLKDMLCMLRMLYSDFVFTVVLLIVLTIPVLIYTVHSITERN